MKKGEVWEVIPGFNGKYFISNFGTVAKKKRYKANNRFQETTLWQYQKKHLVIHYDDYGNAWVRLTYPDGRSTTRAIRRLVAEAFMFASKGDKIYHRDGDPYNCQVGNLRLSSMHSTMRLNKKQIDYCREQHYTHGIRWLEMAERYQIRASALRKIISRDKRRRHGESGSNEVEEGRGIDNGKGEAEDNRRTECCGEAGSGCDSDTE